MRKSATTLSFFLFLFALPLFAAEGWNEYKQRHFIIYYKDAPLEFVKTVEEAAEEYYRQIPKNLGFTRYKGWTWEDRAKIYIYDDAEDYVQNGRQYGWSHGSASPSNRVIRTFPTDHGFFDSTLPHELGHIIFREFVGYRAQVPHWFEEGVAMYQERARRYTAHQIVREALENGTFIPLDELSRLRLTGASSRDLVNLFYAESASVINFLISEYGQFRFVRFCRKLEDGKKFNWALDNVYVRFDDVDDLNEAWVTFLKK